MKEYPEENLSSSKIRRLLKSELKMVFKSLDKVEAKMCSIENISKFYESAGIQILLEKDEWELIYVDEFRVDTRKHVHRGWARRGEKGLLKTDQSGIALNIVVAFSRLRMYGIMINKNANDSLSFIYFLQQLAMIRRASHQLLNNKWWVIADNASIHSSIKVQEWLEKSNMRLITISPYSPSLNPTEKVIAAIKCEIRNLLLESRWFHILISKLQFNLFDIESKILQ